MPIAFRRKSSSESSPIRLGGIPFSILSDFFPTSVWVPHFSLPLREVGFAAGKVSSHDASNFCLRSLLPDFLPSPPAPYRPSATAIKSPPATPITSTLSSLLKSCHSEPGESPVRACPERSRREPAVLQSQIAPKGPIPSIPVPKWEARLSEHQKK